MIIALILTILTEGLVMWFISHSWEWCRYNLYCNLITNPLLNLFLYFAGKLLKGIADEGGGYMLSYLVPLAAGEVAVFLGEALLYRYITAENKDRCMKYSVITNGFSLCVGLIIFFIDYISKRGIN